MLRLVYGLAIGTWLGAVVTMSFLVTPTAHARFPAVEARRFLRPLFPRYYALGIACGLVALGVVALARGALPRDHLLRLALPPAAALVCTVVGREVLLPRLRDAHAEEARFGRLHQTAAILNSTTLGALVLAMAAALLP
jgi:hypothetical protein